MPLVDNAWYVGSVQHAAVTQWATGASIAAGALRRQLAAPAVGSERVFVCIVAGTTHATTEPTWTLTRGAKTTDNTVTWQECTGIAALNGDATSTPNWTTIKNTAIVLGQVIKRDNGASYQICTTAGTAGNGAEPSFSDTAGTTTSDNTVTWTSLGVVGNFTGWQAAHARMQAAVAATWGQAGNSFYTASNHAETQSTAMVFTAPGTAALPCYFYSVNAAGSRPPVSADLVAGASLTGTAAANILLTGGAYWWGFTFNFSSGANASQFRYGPNGVKLVLDNCAIKKLGTTANSSAIRLVGNGNGNTALLNNTTVQFGNVADGILIDSGIAVTWRNTPSAVVLGTAPTGGLFFPNTGFQIPAGPIQLVGVDLANLGANPVVGNAAFTNVMTFLDCKLGSGSIVTPTNLSPGARISIVRCDNAAVNYRHEAYGYEGSQVVETTIVRSGGATDGVTPHSWKLVTTANSRWAFPFEALPIRIWNDVTAANVTVTLFGIWGGGAVPNNDDIWMEVEYLGDGSSPQGFYKTTGKADNLAAGSALSSDTSTWGGSTTKFKMVATLTSPQPAMKGYLLIFVKAAKVSSTFYIDPKPVLS